MSKKRVLALRAPFWLRLLRSDIRGRPFDLARLAANWLTHRQIAEMRLALHLRRLGPMPAKLLAVKPVDIPRSIWVLCPGYGSSSDEFRLVADYMSRAGHEVWALHGKSKLPNIRTTEQVMVRQLEVAREAADRAMMLGVPFGMLGFSRGGRDAAHIYVDLMEQGHLPNGGALISVCTPWRGSRWARYARHLGGQQLAHDSEATQVALGMLAKIHEDPHHHAITLCSSSDEVSRARDSRLPGLRTAIRIRPAHSHWGVLQSHRAVQDILAHVTDVVGVLAGQDNPLITDEVLRPQLRNAGFAE